MAIHAVVGRRATVDVGHRTTTDGWAWRCRSCPATAGLHQPGFIDQDVEILPTITVWMTGEQRALSAARMHANNVCPERRKPGRQ